MGHRKSSENQQMARLVQQHAGIGRAELVAGWQAVIAELLGRAKPYVRSGVLVTLQSLTTYDTNSIIHQPLTYMTVEN